MGNVHQLHNRLTVAGRSLVFVLVIPQSRRSYLDSVSDYVNPMLSQQVATRPVAPLAAETLALSSQSHGFLNAVEVLIYRLASPMRRGRGYGLE